MQVVFIKLLNMSITASWLVLAVVVLRLLLKKAPKSFSVALWALVAIRLIVPFSIESAVSLIPSTQTIPDKVLTGQSFNVNTGIDYVDNRVNDYLGDNYFEGVTVPEDNGMEVMSGLTVLWMVGVALMIGYTFVSYYGIHKKVSEAAYWKDKIWLCDHIDTPFVLGVINPRIYIPSSLNEVDMEYVVAHENAHISRRDNWWKPFGFLLLTVYWFNPFIWLAYILLCRDIELACDEKVIKLLGVESKKPYADALINCSAPRRTIAACPLAFGEVGVKNRLKSILNYKKPAFWIIIVAAIACVAVTVVFLTDPLKTNKELETKTDTDQQERLMEFLEFEFMDHNKIDSYEGSWFAVDCEILETKESDDEITVYLWGMYRIYYYTDRLNIDNSIHKPAIITAKKRDVDYVLSDYWQPRDGSDFEKNVKSKFPEHLQSKALDSQQYVKAQAERCDAEALEYYSSVYIYHDGSEIDEPTVILDRSAQEAGFNYSVFASVGVHGKYELTDTELTITDVNTGEKYVFKVDGNNLVFDASKSAEIIKYDGVNKVPDGAVFEPMAVK